MTKCKYYEVTTENRGIVECCCNGTKERDLCTCGGDKNKCNFSNLEMAIPHGEIMDAVTFLKEKKRMCDYESQAGRNCDYCPIYKTWLENPEDGPTTCEDIGETYPEEVVAMIQKWPHENPEYPTWNEWLHYIYNYYQGFNRDHSTLIFMDWINTRIPEEEAKHWNIPYRKDIVK